MVSAATAPWVSRFYQVAATLETTTTERLLPLEYRELIDEGTRRLDRQVAFDEARREVRITSGGAAITLPLGAGARDPLSALFYIRTLPFGPQSRFSVPISDNGRRVRLDIPAALPETLILDGRSWSAWKLEPRLSDRIERGAMTLSVWVSADRRRIPLRVDVSAGFGSVGLELAQLPRRSPRRPARRHPPALTDPSAVAAQGTTLNCCSNRFESMHGDNVAVLPDGLKNSHHRGVCSTATRGRRGTASSRSPSSAAAPAPAPARISSSTSRYSNSSTDRP